MAETTTILAVKALCQALKLPAVAREAATRAEAAQRQHQSLLADLQQVLEVEVAERAARRAARRLKQAHFPILKTLESFDFHQAPTLPEVLLRQLSEGGSLGLRPRTCEILLECI